MSELDIFDRVYAKCRDDLELSPAQSRMVAGIVAAVEGKAHDEPLESEEPDDQREPG